MLDTLTSPKGIGIYLMIYKDVQIYIHGKQIIQVNKRKARKLYDAGYEVFLHPCKMAFDSIWKEPCEISKEILTDAETKFDKWVNHYQALNCDSEQGRYCRYFVRAEHFDEFNAKNL